MTDLPEDLDPILTEIDNALKAEGIPPHGRPMHAIMRFGTRFHLKMPLTKLPQGAPDDLVMNQTYTARIHEWYDAMYGERLKVDPSANARVAVLADGDVWELRLPIIYGTAVIVAERSLPPVIDRNFQKEPIQINACAALTHVTEKRLRHFSDEDLQEVYGLYCVGLDVRAAFKRFRKANRKFVEAETDWATAVTQLTAQQPNFGQSRWASLQMCEKFMKGLIEVIGDGDPNQRHNLEHLHDELTKSILGMNLKYLLPDLQCTAAVRYGETPSTREQAYAAHKASLLLVKALGSVKNANS